MRVDEVRETFYFIFFSLFNCFVWKMKQKQPTKNKTFTSAYNMGKKISSKICDYILKEIKNKMTTDNFE